MITTDIARSLRSAGLAWRPVSGDAFRIERPDLDSDVFHVSDMTIEPHEFDTGTILGFNGTTEWALDSLAVEHALWLPREDQLRTLLGEAFHGLKRVTPVGYRVELDLSGRRTEFTASSAVDAYATALLHVLRLQTADV
ncbi:hypothetical protein D6T64_15115 [Cryobacterium melibiosiphilum]|uniref:Pilus assembly protein CpaE n=1 Tax=Cryobacterium melibiosiphilum TaxID=995039 RepID=A0A3A5ME17_9MICO|nr:hypothetical protein [Cryobacterium melibiosiphilum]RJT87365.1 hypothetical protein D6T64_15115 [Cryobacterium melibiosiphilum]